MASKLSAFLRADRGLTWTFLWVSGSRLFMLGFTLLGSIIVYRVLASTGPDLVEAGQFAIAMATIRILTNSIGTAADVTMLRRVPILLRSDPQAVGGVVRASFLLRMTTLLTVATIAILFRPWLAAQFLDGADHASIVVLVCAAATSELLLRAALSYFQASEQFKRFVTFEALFQGTRFLCIVGLAVTGTLSVSNFLLTYAGSGFATAALAATQLPRSVLRVQAVPGPVIREAARFFFWSILALGLAAGTERLDLFMLGRFHGADDVGLYGGILTLALIPDFIVGLLTTVLQPRVVKLQEAGELPAFYRRMTIAMLPLGAVAVAVIWLGGPLIVSLTLGARFMADVTTFSIVATGAMIWLVLTPVPATLISLTAPRIMTAMTLAQFVMVVVFGSLLIPPYGTIGAALTLLAVRVIQSGAGVFIGMRLMRRTAPAGAATAH